MIANRVEHVHRRAKQCSYCEEVPAYREPEPVRVTPDSCALLQLAGSLLPRLADELVADSQAMKEAAGDG